MTVGYSGKPLWQKLGLKPSMRLWLRNAPDDYQALLGPEAPAVDLVKSAPADLVHVFVTERKSLENEWLNLAAAARPSGTLWVSWPKGGSGVETDLNENIVREIGLAGGMVDVKVAAVDETWSGLKFVYRLADR